jgi:hypothetical protein
MPKVEQYGMPTSLHYAAYVQTLIVADVADRMEGDFDVINQPKIYISIAIKIMLFV